MPVDAPATTAPPAAPRFSWPVRIFIAVMLFDIVFRSFAVLYPWRDWRDAMDMQHQPRRLPTAGERDELARKATPDDPHPAADRTLETLDSVWNFFKPWPDESVRRHLRSPADGGKFVVCWLNTRLAFVENVLGVQQGWTMFSPSVGLRARVTRSRLLYADGSERIVRNLGDPDDLTHFYRLSMYRVRSQQMEVMPSKLEECFGWCNLLRHRYPHNEEGSPLKKIRLFRAQFDFPPPGTDARQFLREQMEHTRDNVPAKDGPIFPDFYEYEFDGEKWVGRDLNP